MLLTLTPAPGLPNPEPKTPLTPFETPPQLSFALDKSPKSLASPLDDIVT